MSVYDIVLMFVWALAVGFDFSISNDLNSSKDWNTNNHQPNL